MYGSLLLYSLEQSVEDGCWWKWKVSQLTHISHKGISTIIHYHQELSFSHKFNYFVRNICPTRERFPGKLRMTNQNQANGFVCYWRQVWLIFNLWKVKTWYYLALQDPIKALLFYFQDFLDHRTNRFNNREGNSSAIKNRQRALLSPQ